MLRFLSFLASTALLFIIVFAISVTYGLAKINVSLPDYRQLADYEPPVTTRLFAGDGQLMMEYAAEKRLFVPIEKIPEKVKNAFIAAEDKHFYQKDTDMYEYTMSYKNATYSTGYLNELSKKPRIFV